MKKFKSTTLITFISLSGLLVSGCQNAVDNPISVEQTNSARLTEEKEVHVVSTNSTYGGTYKIINLSTNPTKAKISSNKTYKEVTGKWSNSTDGNYYISSTGKAYHGSTLLQGSYGTLVDITYEDDINEGYYGCYAANLNGDVFMRVWTSSEILAPLANQPVIKGMRLYVKRLDAGGNSGSYNIYAIATNSSNNYFIIRYELSDQTWYYCNSATSPQRYVDIAASTGGPYLAYISVANSSTAPGYICGLQSDYSIVPDPLVGSYTASKLDMCQAYLFFINNPKTELRGVNLINGAIITIFSSSYSQLTCVGSY